MAMRLHLFLALISVAAGSKLRRASSTKLDQKFVSGLLPFDCYIGSGDQYEGLLTHSATGRKCKNWLDEGTYSSSVHGIGNHNYCRNPAGGQKTKPWCFTVDPSTEWEYCDVPECPEESEKPEMWTAPEGAKSASAEKGGPCAYAAPQHPGYTTWRQSGACEDHKGDTWWLVSGERLSAASPDDCKSQCEMLPGSEYFTFYFKSSEKTNCGCYRECILADESLTIGSPSVYRLQ